MRITDGMLAIPIFFFLLVVMAIFSLADFGGATRLING
jgi:ABC-type dipeptide/oligopeptide/nickel transport system permease subunit